MDETFSPLLYKHVLAHNASSDSLLLVFYNTYINDEIIVSSHYLQDTVDSGFHHYTYRYQLDIGCNLYNRIVDCVFCRMDSHDKPNLSV